MLERSAVPALDVAVVDAIVTDPALAAILSSGGTRPALDGIHSLQAPAGTQPFYLTLGDGSETGFRTFARSGNLTALTLHLWSGYADRAEITAVYAELRRVLDGTRLLLEEHETVRGRLELVTILAEPPGGTTGVRSHGVARYTVTSQVGAPV